MANKYRRNVKNHGKYHAIINDTGDAPPEYQTSPLVSFNSREELAAAVATISKEISWEGADLNGNLQMKFKVLFATRKREDYNSILLLLFAVLLPLHPLLTLLPFLSHSSFKSARSRWARSLIWL
jgi:hypothetical protein